jgi:hypothetical protein
MKHLKMLFTLLFMLLASIVSQAQSPNNAGADHAADTDQIPRLLSYQGVLQDSEGNAVADGSYTMNFTLYGQAELGNALWSETRQVSLSGGVFHVYLGSVNALMLPFDRAYWLGLTVGEADELAPRTALSATPYSFMARTVADGAVTEYKLAPGAVTESAIADSAVTATKIHPGINITTTGTIQAASFTGDGSGLTGLPTGGFSLPFNGEANQPGDYTLSITNTGINGSGIAAQAPIRGIYGDATATIGFNFGVWGQSQSTDGRGVYGLANALSGTTFGVYGRSQSTDGRGVYGWASTGSGITYGVYGQSQSTDGRGVYGETPATSGSTIGVWGRSASTSGRGVYGEADAASGPTSGVFGTSASTGGRGVYGLATAGSGITYAVYGVAYSGSGTGVYGRTTSETGRTIAVGGHASSPQGFAAYFSGAVGSRNYFERSVSIGTEESRALLTLRGPEDGTFGPTVMMLGDASDQVESGRIRFVEGTALNNWRGAYMHFDGLANRFHLGVHNTNDNSTSNDVNAITITRTTVPRVGIGTEEPGSFRLAVNGDAAKPGGGSWSVFSDERLKRDIRQLEPGSLDRLLQLQGYTFEYQQQAIENRLALPGRQTGLIAQEVLEVFPDWVGNDEEGYLYITERGLTALLIEALRELKIENNSLNHRIDQLEMQLIRITSAE